MLGILKEDFAKQLSINIKNKIMRTLNSTDNQHRPQNSKAYSWNMKRRFK